MRGSHRSINLIHMIYLWIDTTDPHLVTWETVISAIEGPLVYDKYIADRIRKYLKKKRENT